MNENINKYLPIGSIVLLKDATKKLMIIGFYVRTKEIESKVYDYIGCLYPEGVISSDQNLLFNHADINKIYALGYSDNEEKIFKEKLKEEIEKQGN